LRRLIGETVRLETRLSSVPLVRIDPGQLDQVFLNLVVNARDAMPDGGRLTIATDAVAALPAGLLLEGDLAPGPYVMVTVTDTGTGMPREVQARIFEPFFTTKGPGKGTGLGLASVYGVVRQAGGVITVDSQLGVGTRFSLWFPAVQALPSPPPPSEALRTPGGAETVLLAEDESGVRNVASAILRAQGYVVLVAENGTQAARLAAEHAGTIDLLLTDVVMPDFGGRALVDLVRAVRPGVRVLYMSGYTDDAVFRGGTGSPPDAFLQKPFTPGTLARRVREVLDAERAVRPG
jgi:CheY-like chemotaxis protein